MVPEEGGTAGVLQQGWHKRVESTHEGFGRGASHPHQAERHHWQATPCCPQHRQRRLLRVFGGAWHGWGSQPQLDRGCSDAGVCLAQSGRTCLKRKETTCCKMEREGRPGQSE